MDANRRPVGEWGDDYDEASYGTFWAGEYDEIFSEAEGETIAFLRRLAGDPPRALELAIGTGRIALPLAATGVEVVGIDISEEMIARLRSKPGGADLEIVMGDFADVPIDVTFPLVYLPFNTLFALRDQERQIECFANVAEHLEPGGRFVLDCFVPDLARFDAYNTRLGVSSISSSTEHAYEISIHEPVRQLVRSHLVRRRSDGTESVLPVVVRYAWPSEMDLMARLAGLELEERLGWYDRRRYTESSGQHVSVYRKPV
jgi:SAM-dependent methyltransferase